MIGRPFVEQFRSNIESRGAALPASAGLSPVEDLWDTPVISKSSGSRSIMQLKLVPLRSLVDIEDLEMFPIYIIHCKIPKREFLKSFKEASNAHARYFRFVAGLLLLLLRVDSVTFRPLRHYFFVPGPFKNPSLRSPQVTLNYVKYRTHRTHLRPPPPPRILPNPQPRHSQNKSHARVLLSPTDFLVELLVIVHKF